MPETGTIRRILDATLNADHGKMSSIGKEAPRSANCRSHDNEGETFDV
jgi:hypothetical protein